MGLFDGLFNFGNDYLSPGQPTGGQGFPLDSFRQDSFASMMNPIMNYMPQTRSYFDLIQNVPQREDHKLGLGRGIGAALAGLAASFNSPGAGAAVAGSIANAPYLNEMQDFNTRLGAARQGAAAEQGLANLARQFSNDQFQRSQFGQEMGLKEAQLAQQGALGNREIDVKEKALENQQRQQELDRLLQERKITIDQYQSETARINANANVGQSNAMARYYDEMGKAKQNPPDRQFAPNASMSELQFKTAIRADPLFANPKFFSRNSDGDNVFDPQKVMQDPEAARRFAEIARQYGLIK